MSDYPVKNPFITDALVAKIHLESELAGERERAFDSTFRASEAGKCARAMAYASLKYEKTEPVDLAGEWVMWLGSLIGEKVGEALQERFGSTCEVEVRLRHDSLVSGHCDALIKNVPDIGAVLFELKFRGSFAFDKSVGLLRKAYKLQEPEGPGAATKLQGALYASAANADLLVIGSIGAEAVSRQLASRVGFGELARFLAEWHYSRAEYMPWAKAELSRMEQAAVLVHNGLLPSRVVVGDEFEAVSLNPDNDRAAWQCVYCSYRTQCCADGPGNPAAREVSNA